MPSRSAPTAHPTDQYNKRHKDRRDDLAVFAVYVRAAVASMKKQGCSSPNVGRWHRDVQSINQGVTTWRLPTYGARAARRCVHRTRRALTDAMLKDHAARLDTRRRDRGILVAAANKHSVASLLTRPVLWVRSHWLFDSRSNR
jgi:hypothetical protein